MADPTTKQCPYCAEDIKAAAIKCRYCLSDLPVRTSTAPVGDAATAEPDSGSDEVSALDPGAWDLEQLGGLEIRLDLASVEVLDDRLVLHGTASNESGSDRPHYIVLQLSGNPEGQEEPLLVNRQAILGSVPVGATVRWSLPVHKGSNDWFTSIDSLWGKAFECEISSSGAPLLPEPLPYQDPIDAVTLLDSDWARGGEAPGIRINADVSDRSGGLILAPDDWVIALIRMPTATPQVLGVEYYHHSDSSKIIVSGNLQTMPGSPPAVGICASLYSYPDYENAVSAQAATIRGIQGGKNLRWCAFIDVPADQEFLSSIDRLVVMISGVEETELFARHMGWNFFPGQTMNEWTSGRAKQAPGLLSNPNVVLVDSGASGDSAASDSERAAGANVRWIRVADWKGFRFQSATRRTHYLRRMRQHMVGVTQRSQQFGRAAGVGAEAHSRGHAARAVRRDLLSGIERATYRCRPRGRATQRRVGARIRASRLPQLSEHRQHQFGTALTAHPGRARATPAP